MATGGEGLVARLTQSPILENAVHQKCYYRVAGSHHGHLLPPWPPAVVGCSVIIAILAALFANNAHFNKSYLQVQVSQCHITTFKNNSWSLF